jgi:hypothetical protein
MALSNEENMGYTSQKGFGILRKWHIAVYVVRYMQK